MKENLFCPRCGKQFTSETSYCRTCGLSLDGVSKIVSGDAENAPVTTTRPNFKVMRIGIVVFILGMVIGLLNGALRDFNLYPQAYGKLVFLVFIAIGMLMLGSGFLFTVKKYTKQKPSPAATQTESDVKLDTAPLAGQLSPADVDVDNINFPADSREPVTVDRGSVTEHTTRSLE